MNNHNSYVCCLSGFGFIQTTQLPGHPIVLEPFLSEADGYASGLCMHLTEPVSPIARSFDWVVWCASALIIMKTSPMRVVGSLITLIIRAAITRKGSIVVMPTQ